MQFSNQPCIKVNTESSHNNIFQSVLITCNHLYRYNDNFSIILGLSKGTAISWLLKSTSATAFAVRSNRERLPGDAPVPPDLMNLFKENGGKKEWENFQMQVVSWKSFKTTVQTVLRTIMGYH